MRYDWATATHVGRVRSGNEDAVFPHGAGAGEGSMLIGVADGMGGHVGGEVASRLAVEAASDVDGGVVERVKAANGAVVARALEDPNLVGMGTTLTIAEIADEALQIGHVGDSRAYLYRDGELRQITTDHSLIAELLAAGKITEEDVATHPQRSVVTRALGMARAVRVDHFTEELRPGDRLLLCSDGLTTMIDDAAIAGILAAEEEPEAAAWALVEAANSAGGVDNITVAVVDAAE